MGRKSATWDSDALGRKLMAWALAGGGRFRVPGRTTSQLGSYLRVPRAMLEAVGFRVTTRTVCSDPVVSEVIVDATGSSLDLQRLFSATEVRR